MSVLEGLVHKFYLAFYVFQLRKATSRRQDAAVCSTPSSVTTRLGLVPWPSQPTDDTYVPGQHAPVCQMRRHVTRLCLQCRLVPPLGLLVLVQPRMDLPQKCVHRLQRHRTNKCGCNVAGSWGGAGRGQWIPINGHLTTLCYLVMLLSIK